MRARLILPPLILLAVLGAAYSALWFYAAGVVRDGIAQWVAAGLVLGHAFAPRETRALAATFTVYGLSDALNLAYSAAQQHA